MSLDTATHVCAIEHTIQLVSAVFAIAAAILWAKSAFAGNKIRIEDKIAMPGEPVPGLVTLVANLKKQSLWSAAAAGCAGTAALLQALLVFFPTCWSGSPWFLVN